MPQQIDLAAVEAALEDLSYPVLRPDAATEFAHCTLVLDDGEANLGQLISETDSDAFDSAAALRTELDEALAKDGVDAT
ncbi:hypothetical protein G9464_08690 [Halostella sp. JP-L12]|uniref:DUF5789 family protein n=1 Tax=Halostella TaxID=1843185 RepID=UPI000EF85290|nr:MULTISPECIES: hypothetical protein [Halostella]NHN47673.1 hypothetical protein [Halostella sp. JP-L12]